MQIRCVSKAVVKKMLVFMVSINEQKCSSYAQIHMVVKIMTNSQPTKSSLDTGFTTLSLIYDLETSAEPVALAPVKVAEQLLASHPYPVGQHPPPAVLAHMNHPVAQAPFCWPETLPEAATMPSPVGPSTIVTPLDTSKVEEIRGGQDVTAQSRST